jgi:NDP-sugar pyrophosphorylase family protein
MLNIVMPMAGRGKRFADAGYASPKPLIPVHGRPMTEVVIENLRPACPHRFVFLILREHAEAFGFDRHLRAWAPGSEVRYVEHVTEGAACTVLLARDLIDTDDPLMIANCDQWVDVDVNDYLAAMDRDRADGLIMTMWSDDPKWSFVRFDGAGEVVEVLEKQVVSNEATVGIYNYRRGRDFVRAAGAMIGADLRVNGEFYVAPTYNQLIPEGRKIAVHNVGKEDAGMYGLGIPADLERFLAHPVSRKAVAFAGDGR